MLRNSLEFLDTSLTSFGGISGENIDQLFTFAIIYPTNLIIQHLKEFYREIFELIFLELIFL